MKNSIKNISNIVGIIGFAGLVAFIIINNPYGIGYGLATINTAILFRSYGKEIE